jgi:cell division protein FtsA
MPLAAAAAVLSAEERELGVALVDIGSGTTDIAVFHDGTVRHSAVLSVGGNHLTNDIAAGLRTPTADAERIKQRYGLAKASTAFGDQRVDISSVTGRTASTVSRQILCEIIEPRMEEIFQLVQREVVKSGYEGSLASGVVLTGGSMLLPGAVETAEQVFGMPARLGSPIHVVGLVDVVSSPIYAAGVGLVLCGMKSQARSLARFRDDRILSKVRHRMSDWLSEFF